ncbi:MAG: cupin domain-containing protein [Deltaproteobacteria bacterium]|nr:cupin domain-containing protein [Deltaproteobacteria bacterium]
MRKNATLRARRTSAPVHHTVPAILLSALRVMPFLLGRGNGAGKPKEEEFVYVLQGEVDAWIDGDLHPMKAGDLVAFPAGTGICHTILNDSEGEALLLVGGERPRPDNRIFYPLHPSRRGDLAWSEWWDDVPRRELGPHDGVPRASRKSG